MKINPFSLVGAGIVLVLLIFVPQFLPTYYIGLLTLILIFALFAMSLDILLGYGGLPSLGHAAFFGVGGYIAGIMSTKVANNFELNLVLSLTGAVICAAIFGLVALRAKSHYFLIITLALSQMLWAIAFKWRTVTGGSDGFSGIPRPLLSLVTWDLTQPIDYYYFVLIFFSVAAALLYLIVKSPFAITLMGIRESEIKMISLGYNAWYYKFLAFVIAGFFAGLTGVLHVHYNGYVGPGELGVVLSTEALLMVILGGAGTLVGPAIGAAIIVLGSNIISANTERWVLVLGILYVLVVVICPNGIYPPIRQLLGRNHQS